MHCVTFHPNCNYVLTGSLDATARLWDVQSGSCVRVFAGHFGSVDTVSVSPDGKTIATAGEDNFVNLWDIGSGKKLATLHGHTRRVQSIDFSREGTLLASGSDDCSLRLWDAKAAAPTAAGGTQKPLKTLYTKSTPIMHVRFTNRNLLLAAGAFTAVSDLS